MTHATVLYVDQDLVWAGLLDCKGISMLSNIQRCIAVMLTWDLLVFDRPSSLLNYLRPLLVWNIVRHDGYSVLD